MNDFLPTSIDYSNRLQSLLFNMQWQSLETLGVKLLECWKNKQHVFICGNGGSAANAIHIANDLVYGAGGLKAEALSANTAVLTCLANDLSYEDIYAQQIKIKASAGDLLIILSGSGNSKNIILALNLARKIGSKTIGFMGNDGGGMKDCVDVGIIVPSNDTARIQEVHITIGHIICEIIEQDLIHENKI